MSSLHPATISFSLHEFARHGGQSAPNGDGWGIAYYRERAAQVIREPSPASESPLIRFLERQEWEGKLFISHLRRATRGDNALSNTQPFERELAGRSHVFAHNGELPDLRGLPLGPRYRPMGETDSEHAFCHLLERLGPVWDCRGIPELARRVEVFAAVATELRRIGIANILYSDGDALFAHAHVRPAVHDRRAMAPGLHWLHRSAPPEVSPFRGRAVEVHTEHVAQEVCLLASVPLTEERWSVAEEGEILVVRAGKIEARFR